MVYFFFDGLGALDFLSSAIFTLRSFFRMRGVPSAFVRFFKVLYAIVSSLFLCFLAYRSLKRSKSFNEVLWKQMKSCLMWMAQFGWDGTNPIFVSIRFEIVSTSLYQTAIPIKWFRVHHDSQDKKCALNFAYLLNALCLFAPSTKFPLLLQIVCSPSLAHNSRRCMEWEVQSELGQLQIIQTICLTWYTALWSINQHLQFMKRTIFINIYRSNKRFTLCFVLIFSKI